MNKYPNACVVCGESTHSTIFTTCMGCYDRAVGFPVYGKNINFPTLDRVYEDYLYYVLKKKDNNVYLDDMDEETENLSDAYFTEGLQDMEFAKSIQDNPEVWEIKRIKVTYELLESEDGE